MARFARLIPVPTLRTRAPAMVAVVAVLSAFAGLVAVSAPAHADAGFRFWGYYHLSDGTWASSTKGADAYTAEDGDVEGFRYATTTQSQFNRPPRAVPTFEEICGGTEAAQGEKRVGVVIDYGTAQDAPEGAQPPQAEADCAVVPADATTQQAVESVKPLRVEQGLICAIDGYPSSGCAQEVADATVPRGEKPVDLALPGEEDGTESGNSAGVAAGVAALVVVLGGGAFAVSRRRRG